MNKTLPFDEMQINNRNKFGAHAFSISMILILVNIVIKYYYGIWASSLTEGMCMLLIPLFYFNTRCILSDAFLSNNKKIKSMYIADFFIMSIFFTLYIIFTNRLSIINNGILSDNFSIILIDIFVVFTGIICLIKNGISST